MVTGAAGDIGRATAVALGLESMSVLLADVHTDGIEKTVRASCST